MIEQLIKPPQVRRWNVNTLQDRGIDARRALVSGRGGSQLLDDELGAQRTTRGTAAAAVHAGFDHAGDLLGGVLPQKLKHADVEIGRAHV